jgi:hypothetical protein
VPIVDLTIKQANAKWPNLKINEENELIVIEGEFFTVTQLLNSFLIELN